MWYYPEIGDTVILLENSYKGKVIDAKDDQLTVQLDSGNIVELHVKDITYHP
jgi:hypothetical protein